jgi:hypothetical protein
VSCSSRSGVRSLAAIKLAPSGNELLGPVSRRDHAVGRKRIKPGTSAPEMTTRCTSDIRNDRQAVQMTPSADSYSQDHESAKYEFASYAMLGYTAHEDRRSAASI